MRPRTPSPARAAALPHRSLLAVAGLAAAAHSLLLATAFRFQNVDDAYIAFRYGAHLVRGQGLVFNAGERVEGYTSFLWTVLLAPFTALPVDVVVFSIALGLAASLAALAGFAVLVRREAAAQGGATWPYAALLLVACDGSWAFWAIAGLETSLFAALVVWSVVLLEAPREKPLPIGAGLLLGLATLTRPEGALLFALAMADRLLRRGPHALADARALALGFGVLVLPHLAWRRAYYGTWVPNTFQTKVTLGLAAIQAGWAYATSFVAWRFGVPLLALAALARGAPRALPPLSVTFTAAFTAYIVAVGGDWPIANRFFVPVIPFAALFVARGIATLLRAPAPRAAALALAVLAVALGTSTRAEWLGMVRENDNVGVEEQRKRFGLWLRDEVSPGTLVAVGPAGAIPYYSRLPSLDLWGLTDAHMARAPRLGFEPGHDRFDPEYILSREPRIIVGEMRIGVPPGYEFVNQRIPEAVRPREPVFARPGVFRETP